MPLFPKHTWVKQAVGLAVTGASASDAHMGRQSTVLYSLRDGDVHTGGLLVSSCILWERLRGTVKVGSGQG